MKFIIYIVYYTGVLISLYSVLIDYSQVLSQWILRNSKNQLSYIRIRYMVLGSIFWRLLVVFIINFILHKICGSYNIVTIKTVVISLMTLIILLFKTLKLSIIYKKFNIISSKVTLLEAVRFTRLNKSKDMLYPYDLRWNEIEPIKLTLSRPKDSNGIAVRRITPPLASFLLKTFNPEDKALPYFVNVYRRRLIQVFELNYTNPNFKDKSKILVFYRTGHKVIIPTCSSIRTEEELKEVFNALNYIHIKQTKHSLSEIQVLSPKSKMYTFTKNNGI